MEREERRDDADETPAGAERRKPWTSPTVYVTRASDAEIATLNPDATSDFGIYS